MGKKKKEIKDEIKNENENIVQDVVQQEETIQIKKNMLRESADKKDPITDEMWLLVDEENRQLVEEFLRVNNQLSKETRLQYTTCLKQFFYYTYEFLRNKKFYKITKRDFMGYMSSMTERGLSSSAIKLRKSACSSFCNYIENIVMDDVEEYKQFRNFTRGMPSVAKNNVYEKVLITKEEYKIIMEYLEKKGHYLGLAWVSTAFNVGGRRAELVQFKTEILNYPIPEGQNYVLSHTVRGKGKSVDGKPLKYMINFEALKYMKLWVEKRGYDHDYIFSVKTHEGIAHMSKRWANSFCRDILTPLLGRRINPHLFKASCVTHLLQDGVDMSIVSKYIAHHSDISTTSIYDLRSFEEEKNNIFGTNTNMKNETE
jgi:site-specific recombinase XerD